MQVFLIPDAVHGKTKYKVEMGLLNIKTQLPSIIYGVEVCHFSLPH